MNIQHQLNIIKRGAAEIISEEELVKKLQQNRPLIIKAGFDPTAPDIHLGHTVLLRKLRHFQDLGHTVIFLIGDATGLVGDPSGQSQTRKTLTWEEVKKNALTYEKQIGKILNTADPKLFRIRYNSEWFSRYGGPIAKDIDPFGFNEFVELAKRYTVARLLERDDFEKRMRENKPISFLELFYPLMQGYDSYKLKADIEIGGTDQKFNMLVGRDIQRAYEDYDKNPQVVITMPILEGTDGVQKMSKSLGNYIGINESPREIFGKVMSVSDEMMWKYYELLTDISLEEVRKLHPKEAKQKLASEIVAFYYTKEAAVQALEEFERLFKQKELPDDISLKRYKAGKDEISICELVDLGFDSVSSKAEFRRLIQQGGVKVNGDKISDIHFKLARTKEYLIQLGKRRFAKVVVG